MQKPDPTYVATEEYLWIRSDGSHVRLIARVSTPYRVEDQQWACPAELEGLDGRYPDIHGGSSMQAICLALRLVGTRLGHLLETGEHLAYLSEPTSRIDAGSLANVFGIYRNDG